MSDWQPIETAPLDHWVLLSDKSGFVWMIIFTKEYKSYTKATHWMPMPKPPEINE